MTSAHRPLSDWIADLIPAPTPHLGTVNDGLERQDARTMPRFADGWERRRVEVTDHNGISEFALGLQTEDGEEFVVELDDHGRALPISPDGLDVITEMEQRWPVTRLTPEQMSVLTEQPVAIRFVLLHRLVAEGTPGPRMFHMLPWDRVDAAAEHLLAALTHGDESRQEWDWLGHWFSPAVAGLAGALDQLGQGVSDGDEAMIRVAATALCTVLVGADVDRIPAPTASRLVALVGGLSRRNPFLHHTADLARARLVGEDNVVRYSLETRARLTKAAGSGAAKPHVVRTGDENQLEVEMTTSRAGRLTVTATLQLPSGAAAEGLLSSYGGVFLPVTYHLDGDDQTYWIALRRRATTMSGDIIVDARFGRVDADAAPVGVAELEMVAPAKLVVSIDAADVAGRRVWRTVADDVPTTHPVAQAVRLWSARLEDDRE